MGKLPKNTAGLDTPRPRSPLGELPPPTSNDTNAPSLDTPCPRSPSASKARPLAESYTITGSDEVINVGDCVFIRSEDRSKPYVARIEKIESKSGKAKVKLLWYYKPEETDSGRRSFHGSKEVFLSDHHDSLPAETIEGKCHVYNIDSYLKLDIVHPDEFFCRFDYISATGRFFPHHAEVYCVCENPYNPDLLMLECEECKNWFHPSCLKVVAEEYENFLCSRYKENEKEIVAKSIKKGGQDAAELQSNERKCYATIRRKNLDEVKDHWVSEEEKGHSCDIDLIPSVIRVSPKSKEKGEHSTARACTVPVSEKDMVKSKRTVRAKRAEARSVCKDTAVCDRKVALISNDDMLGHKPPAGAIVHEKPERITCIMEKLKNEGLTNRCCLFSCDHATKESLLAVHQPSHVINIQTLSDKDYGVHGDIYYSEGSTRAALLAAGGALKACDLVASGEYQSCFAIVRPPGHHVESDGPAAGFCLLNNIAVGAAHLLNEYKMKRILILDWDVHHGNGTENIFYDDKRVLVFSLHRYEDDFYPETGSVSRTGEGYNINVCWKHPRIRDADYLAVWEYILLPVIQEFRPEIIMISAGFDAAENDPLGECEVTPSCFSHILEKLTSHPIVMVLEGGYNLDSISDAVAACVRVLLGEKSRAVNRRILPYDTTWIMVEETRQKHSSFWKAFEERIPGAVTSRSKRYQ